MLHEAAVAPENVPGWQGLHAIAPSGEYVPGRHATGVVVPLDGQLYPAGQGLYVPCLEVVYAPGGARI